MVQAHPSPPRMKVVQSAGALVWRFRDGTGQSYRRIPKSRDEIEVLLVHRPRYNDWSWPKGKKEIREPLPTCAVREVEEETGYMVRLGAPLTTQRYRLGLGATKEVHYWVGFLDVAKPAVLARPATNLAPVTEIDKTAWVGVEEACKRLARKGDKRLLEELLVRLDRQELFTKTVLIATNADVAESGSKAELQLEISAPAKAETISSTPAAGRDSAVTEMVGKPTITPAMIAKKIHRAQLSRSYVQLKPAPSTVGIQGDESGGSVKDFVSDESDNSATSPAGMALGQPDMPSESTVKQAKQQGVSAEQQNLSRAGVSEVLRLIPLLSAYGAGALASSSWRRSLATCVPYATLSGAELTIRKELNPSSSIAENEALQRIIREVLLSESGEPECICIHPESLPPVVGEMAQICPSWLLRRLPQGETTFAEGALMVLHLSYQPDSEAPLKLYDLEVHPVKA